MERKKNHYLNYLKGIACFGVVFLHTRVPNITVDGLIQTIFRAAVPLFFMISGYYIYNNDYKIINKKLPQKMKYIFKLGSIGFIYYLFFQIFVALFGEEHGSIQYVLDTLKDIFSIRKIINFVIFNVDPVINILWFIFSLLYCYIIVYFINKFNWYNVSYKFIPILIFVNLFLGNGLTLINIDINNICYRNFLFFGLPFFLLGNLIHRYETVITKRLTTMYCKILLLLGIGIGFIEWFLVGRQELYIGSIIVVCAVFIYALTHEDKKKENFLTFIGEKYALFIYIVHISVGVVLNRIVSHIPFYNIELYRVYQYLRPLIVALLSSLMAWAFYKLVQFISAFNLVDSLKNRQLINKE